MEYRYFYSVEYNKDSTSAIGNCLGMITLNKEILTNNGLKETFVMIIDLIEKSNEIKIGENFKVLAFNKM